MPKTIHQSAAVSENGQAFDTEADYDRGGGGSGDRVRVVHDARERCGARGVCRLRCADSRARVFAQSRLHQGRNEADRRSEERAAGTGVRLHVGAHLFGARFRQGPRRRRARHPRSQQRLRETLGPPRYRASSYSDLDRREASDRAQQGHDRRRQAGRDGVFQLHNPGREERGELHRDRGCAARRRIQSELAEPSSAQHAAEMMPTLYDAYNRPVDFDALRLEQAAPEFIGVRNIYAVEHPEIGLTPNKLAGILRQAEMGDPYFYFEVAEAMEEKDLHYYSVLHTRKAAVNALEISVQAASAGKEDVYAADLVREVLIDGECDLPEAFSDILDALGKGVSATEIIWDTQGDQWYPTGFDWISGEQLLVRSLRSEGKPFEAPFQVREQQTPTGGTIGIQPGSQPLAPFKFITHFGKAKSGLPIRGGLARIAAWAYLFKNYVLKDWVTFAEI